MDLGNNCATNTDQWYLYNNYSLLFINMIMHSRNIYWLGVSLSRLHSFCMWYNYSLIWCIYSTCAHLSLQSKLYYSLLTFTMFLSWRLNNYQLLNWLLLIYMYTTVNVYCTQYTTEWLESDIHTNTTAVNRQLQPHCKFPLFSCNIYCHHHLLFFIYKILKSL